VLPLAQPSQAPAACKIAEQLRWETTEAAGFLALTQPQADAFVTSGDHLARGLRHRQDGHGQRAAHRLKRGDDSRSRLSTAPDGAVIARN
jgi:hypothetical protein